MVSIHQPKVQMAGMCIGAVSSSFPKPPAPMRYLRLERFSNGTVHLSCTALEAYAADQWLGAISGTMASVRNAGDSRYTWPNVQDKNDTTMAFSSNPCIGDYLELDFGALTTRATSIHMMHGEGLGGGWERSIGVTLFVLDGARNIIFQHTWSSMPLTRSETFTI